jgi:hypothetical protein
MSNDVEVGFDEPAHRAGEEALLGPETDDQPPGREAVRGPHLVMVGVEQVDFPGQSLGLRFVEPGGLVGVGAAEPCVVKHCSPPAHWRFEGFAGADPDGRVGELRRLEGQIRAADEELLEGGGLLRVAGVERVRAEELLEAGVVERDGHVSCSGPSASKAAATRRNPRRSRDFAVPSGMPSCSATCR